MLINCPRCGFSQPQDQYCAQCGVDMQAFKPKKKPFWENPALQIAVIVVVAGLLVKNILGNSSTSILGKRTSFSQGYTRSEKKSSGENFDSDSRGESAYASSSETETTDVGASESDQTRGSQARAAAAAAEKTAGGLTAPGSALGDSASGVADGTVTFKLTYAEVASEVVARWMYDSTNLGLYQALNEYSVGILYDFKKRGDTFKQTLKTADIKVLPGSNAANLSGVMSDDGSQLIGFAASVELKPSEGEALQGSIVVTKNSRSGTENFPSEFELPKGAAFFILGALKTENFAAERSKLQMPPFQIFKSPDFMTHKAEFVIILEPDYK